MPGMMDTVLNIGLSDESVQGLAKQAGNERFAWDAYRRLLQMFGKTVLDIDGELFEHAIDEAKKAKGVRNDLDLDAADLQHLVDTFKGIVKSQTGHDFPQEPRQQLDLAIKAVFNSWNSDRAILYRRQERIPTDLGTAVNVVAMVFGNLGEDSGTGVAFTRDPGTGAQGVYGDYLQNAQGEDVVAGIRNTVPLQDLEGIDKASYDQLMQIMHTLENHYRDLCDIEFTVERGKLWMLQTRVGKRTAAAAFRIATQLVDQGLIDMDEAVRRVSGEELARLMFPRFDTSGEVTKIATGISASPGAAVGKVVFDSARAVELAGQGERVILVRRETNPDDLHGMIAAQGILTSRGGKTSHAAVVARGMGKTCVCGAEQIEVDAKAKKFTAPGGITVSEGDVISIDGTSGVVYLGEIPVVASEVVRYFEGELHPHADEADDLIRAVHSIMHHADQARRLGVYANADTGPDCERARRFGAGGVGLVRTEHMFLGERRQLVEDLILAEGPAERDAALAALMPLQREDFVGLLAAMDGLPTTIRLLDPPLHEFLPDRTELAVRVAVAKATGEPDPTDVRLLAAVERLHEANPMLGLRGVRLGLVVPGLFAMQVRAIVEAAAQRKRDGGDPRVEIMVPLVGSVMELHLVRDEIDGHLPLVHDFDVGVAGGQGEMKGKIFRIGHMGFIDHFDTLGLFSALELTLISGAEAASPERCHPATKPSRSSGAWAFDFGQQIYQFSKIKTLNSGLGQPLPHLDLVRRHPAVDWPDHLVRGRAGRAGEGPGRDQTLGVQRPVLGPQKGGLCDACRASRLVGRIAPENGERQAGHDPTTPAEQ
jgi:pyruvate,orthophosphate dikinase